MIPGTISFFLVHEFDGYPVTLSAFTVPIKSAIGTFERVIPWPKNRKLLSSVLMEDMKNEMSILSI